MRYVALLRGVNVGGKAKVEMARLKTVFAQLGMKNVSTYINSGNVVFGTDLDQHGLSSLIEEAIENEFGMYVPVVVRNADQINQILLAVSENWINDSEQRTDVMFLWNDIDNEHILQAIHINPEIESVLYVPGALVWNIAREHVLQGGGIKLIKTDVYKKMTIRNINTVRKLKTLL